MVAELAERELGWLERPVVTLERMGALTLEIMLRVVFGARDDDEVEPLRDAVARHARHVRSLPRMLAMALVQRDSARAARGAASGSRSSASTRCCWAWWRDGAREPPATPCSTCCSQQRDEDGKPPTRRQLRDQLVALLAGGPRDDGGALAWAFERLAATRPCRRACARATRPTSTPWSRRSCGAAGADDRAAPAARAGGDRRATLPAGVHVAACLWLALRREDLWPQAGAFRPERWLEGAAPRTRVVDPVRRGVRRCAGAPFAEMEMREVLRAAARTDVRPVRPEPERARRSALVVTPHRGGEVIVERA